MARSAESLRQFYEHQYPRDLTAATVLRDDDFMYGQILREIKPYLHPGVRALDLGCGTGGLSLYMARAGCEVLGIDIAQNAIDVARRSADHYGVGNAQFESIDFLREWSEPDVFDFVLCSHVVEHVAQDELFVRKIAYAIKSNGHLVLITPTVYSSLYWVSRILTGQFAHDDEVGHLRRYTRQGITAIVQRAGFGIDRVVFLDSLMRDWFILCKPLRVFDRIWARHYVRTVFNRVDSLLAAFLCPAAVCVHAQRQT